MRLIFLALTPVFADLIGYNRNLNNIFTIRYNQGASFRTDYYRLSIALHMVTSKKVELAKRILGKSKLPKSHRLRRYKRVMKYVQLDSKL